MDELCRDTIKFQSTLSVRRATDAFGRVEKTDVISIHALRKESDASTFAVGPAAL